MKKAQLSKIANSILIIPILFPRWTVSFFNR
jgi:hypothetical protein